MNTANPTPALTLNNIEQTTLVMAKFCALQSRSLTEPNFAFLPSARSATADRSNSGWLSGAAAWAGTSGSDASSTVLNVFRTATGGSAASAPVVTAEIAADWVINFGSTHIVYSVGDESSSH